MILDVRTGNGGSMDCSSLVSLAKNSVLNGCTVGNGVDNNTDGNWEACSVDTFRTYKRRKHKKLCSENSLQTGERVSEKSRDELTFQAMIKPVNQSLDCNANEDGYVSAIDCPVIQTRGNRQDVLLEHILPASTSNNGTRSCIQDTIDLNPFFFTTMHKMHGPSGQSAQGKETICCRQHQQKYHNQLGNEPSGSWNAAKEHMNSTSNGAENDPSDEEDGRHVTELCQRVFLSIIASEKFNLLCKLLSENFQGTKVDSFLDFNVIDSRMKDGTYEQSPELFFSDIQQVWEKFQKIGAEMLSLAKSLSNISRTSFCQQGGGLLNGDCEKGVHKGINQVGLEQKDYLDPVKMIPARESDWHKKSEKRETCSLNKVCTCSTCSRCGDKANGKDFLVCDSCEEIYHVSCIEPAVEEIPPRSWFCANCTARHENCVVCERLKDSRALSHHGGGHGVVPSGEDGTKVELDCRTEAKRGHKMQGEGIMICKICKIREENEEIFWLCQHLGCPYRYYHERCLTSNQLKSYGPRWYCPSCLCRSCLTDRDDDKIILCDGCDYAYHFYCLEPPHTSVPKGKWFCASCTAGMQEVRKNRKAYENHVKHRRNGQGGADKTVAPMDMLLNAVDETIKSDEEKLGLLKCND